MANKNLTMLQSKSILMHLIRGKTVGEISSVLNISRNTIKKYLKRFNNSGLAYQMLFDLPSEEFASYVYPQKTTPAVSARLETLRALLPTYAERLTNSHSTRQTLWQEYISQHADGYSYTQFCEHFAQYLKQKKVVMKLEHKAGDVLQIDFAGDKLGYTDPQSGKPVMCPVLVCTMPYSAFCYVEALTDMSQLHLIGALNRCMEYLGGVPSNICSDNLKQVVNQSDKYEPVFSELMMQFALHYKTSFTATRVVKPRDKASVERHVSIAYTSIYAYLEGQQFNSLKHLNYHLRMYLDALNDKQMQGKTYSRRAQFEQYEKPLLQTLPPQAFEIKCQTSAKVQNNYHVILGKNWHNYSVPFQHVGKRVKIIYDSQYVEIFLDMKLIALHTRKYTRNGFTTNNDHRPENHKEAAFMQQITPGKIRAQAKLIGCNTKKYTECILSRNFFSIQNLKSCVGILNLAKHYGENRVERACGIALNGLEHNYKTIKNILENNMDKTQNTDLAKPITDKAHKNVRGNDYFTEFFKN